MLLTSDSECVGCFELYLHTPTSAGGNYYPLGYPVREIDNNVFQPRLPDTLAADDQIVWAVE